MILIARIRLALASPLSISRTFVPSHGAGSCGERGFDGVLDDSRVVARENELGVAREGGLVVEDSRLVVSGREPELEKGRRRVGHDVHVAHF